jgi:hypothetical protein
VALPWQILTFLLPMGMVLGRWDVVLPALVPWLILSYFVMRRPRQGPGAAVATP